MNISYNWLKQYIDINEGPEELSVILTDLGLEIGGVEKVESIKGGLEGLVIGEVLSKTQHPNADKLSCTKVNVGGTEPLSIVCGAANVAAGQKVVVATVGTILYSGEESFKIKKSKLRGELSEGMICAEDEIGLGDSHDGIMVLPNDVPAGTLAKDYFNVETDYILEVDITPNRADALSHLGVARDLAVYYGYKKKSVSINYPSTELPEQTADLPTKIEIEDTEACKRYAGLTLKGVEVKSSPDWLKTRLSAIGLKPINNVVDVTNFVLHETGQPLHAFDYAVTKGEIVVKSNCGGVEFVTLDGEKRTLKDGQLMICNGSEPMCIAGVFGGEKSGVSEGTTDIFLESAYFEPVSVRKTSKDHNLKTDASYRFERGVDPLNTVEALKRAAALILEIAGGELASDIQDVQTASFEPFEVDFSVEKCQKLLGDPIEKDEILTIFKGLDIEVIKDDGDTVTVAVPPYRVDVKRQCDLVEEILRVKGYNSVVNPSHLKSTLIVEDGIPQQRIVKVISDLLTNSGFNEILNNSLTKKGYYENSESYAEEAHVELLNPLSQDLNILRRSLLFGGLESVLRNHNMKNPNLKFYEFGKTYLKEEDGIYKETKHLGIWLSGQTEEGHWSVAPNQANFFALKGFVQKIVERLGIQKLKMKSTENEFLTDSIGLYFKKIQIVELGKVKKSVLKNLGIKQDVYFADFNWDEVLKLVQFVKTKFKPLPKFHPVKRDLSLLLDESIKYSELERIAYESERKLLKEVELFDVYQGDKLPKGKKSYALSFKLESDEGTLKDKQIEKVMDKLQTAFTTKLSAEVR